VTSVVTTRRGAVFNRYGCEALAIEALSEKLGDPRIPPVGAGQAWGRILFTSGTTGAGNKAIVNTHE